MNSSHAEQISLQSKKEFLQKNWQKLSANMKLNIIKFSTANECARFQEVSKDSLAIAKNSLLWKPHIENRFPFIKVSREKNCHEIFKRLTRRDNEKKCSRTLSDVKKNMYYKRTYNTFHFSITKPPENKLIFTSLDSESNKYLISVLEPSYEMTSSFLRQGKQHILNYYYGELLKMPKEIKTTFSFEFAPPVYWAVRFNQQEIVSYFFETEEYDINQQYKDGNTLLHVAALSGNIYIANLLIHTIKANVNTVNQSGDTALHLASELGHADIVYFLLAARSNPNLKNNDKKTPLRIAASKNNLRTAGYLLESKADVEVLDIHGNTPLSTAAFHGHFAMVKLLLHYKADVCKEYMNFDIFKTAFDISQDIKTKKLLLLHEVNAFISSIEHAKKPSKPSLFSKQNHLVEATILKKLLETEDKIAGAEGLFKRGRSLSGKLGVLFQKAYQVLNQDDPNKQSVRLPAIKK